MADPLVINTGPIVALCLAGATEPVGRLPFDGPFIAAIQAGGVSVDDALIARFLAGLGEPRSSRARQAGARNGIDAQRVGLHTPEAAQRETRLSEHGERAA